MSTSSKSTLVGKINPDASGLTQTEAEHRLRRFGYNDLQEKNRSPLLEFWIHFWWPIPWMIEAAVILSMLTVSTSADAQDVPTKWPLPPIPQGATVYPDLSYVTNGAPSQKLDLYVPKEGRKLPLIIFVHAGAFYMGDKRKWIRYQLSYLGQGYAMASINYRLNSEAVFPAQH